MKKNTNSGIQRLEKKINLLNDKIDKLMAAQGVSLQTPEEINEEEEKKRKILYFAQTRCENEKAGLLVAFTGSFEKRVPKVPIFF